MAAKFADTIRYAVTSAQEMYALKSLVRYKFYRILLVEPKEIAMIMMPLSRHI